MQNSIINPNEKTGKCIIPDAKWDGNTGIQALIERYRAENPDLYYSERVHASHRTARVKGIDYD